MRPILVNIPSKFLFFLALGLAVGSVVRDVLRRRKDPKAQVGATALYLLVAAGILVRLKTGSVLPSPLSSPGPGRRCPSTRTASCSAHRSSSGGSWR